MRAPFAHKPTLSGELVELRPFRDEDLPHLKAAIDDPETGRLTGSVHSSDEVDDYPLEKLREWYGSRNDQTDRLDLMVVDRATGTCVGEVVLNQWDEGSESCNFRILLGASGQGRGLGTEATLLLLGYASSTCPCTGSSSRSTPSTREPSGPTRRPASWSRAAGGTRCSSTASGSTPS